MENLTCENGELETARHAGRVKNMMNASRAQSLGYVRVSCLHPVGADVSAKFAAETAPTEKPDR